MAHRHLIRRLIASAAALAIALFAAASLFGAVPGRQDSSALQTRATTSGALSQRNSRDGEAIFATTSMAPGSSTAGTVTIDNTGSLSGALTLAAREPSDSPGTYGGVLSQSLDLRVADITSGPDDEVYSGKLSPMPDQELGTVPGGASRTYRFTVSMPDEGGPGEVWTGDNVYQHATASVGYEWTLTETADEEPAPTPDPAPGSVPIPADQAPSPESACPNAIIGTSGPDSLFGTDSGDRIVGLGGRDSLSGAGGDDCINGGRGNDKISGGTGDDRLHGGLGSDQLLAGEGDDFVYSLDKRRDLVICGPGSDRAVVDRIDLVDGCEHVSHG